jgi:hypothetical protein
MGAEAGPGAGLLTGTPKGGGVTANGRELGGSVALGPWRVRRAGDGAGTVNELIREALYPYPDGLAILSKVAARREAGGAVLRSDEPHELR